MQTLGSGCAFPLGSMHSRAVFCLPCVVFGLQKSEIRRAHPQHRMSTLPRIPCPARCHRTHAAAAHLLVVARISTPALPWRTPPDMPPSNTVPANLTPTPRTSAPKAPHTPSSLPLNSAAAAGRHGHGNAHDYKVRSRCTAALPHACCQRSSHAPPSARRRCPGGRPGLDNAGLGNAWWHHRPGVEPPAAAGCAGVRRPHCGHKCAGATGGRRRRRAVHRDSGPPGLYLCGSPAGGRVQPAAAGGTRQCERYLGTPAPLWLPPHSHACAAAVPGGQPSDNSVSLAAAHNMHVPGVSRPCCSVCIPVARISRADRDLRR